MRVPVQTQQTVAAGNPFGDTSPNLQRANLGTAQALGSVAQDVGQLGQAAGNAMEQQAREERQASAKALHDAEQAKKRAEELQIADGLVDLQRRVGDDESKFLGRRGLDALRASGSTLDAFDKYVDEGSQRYTDPTQKLEFQVRAKQALLAARRSVETHTTREYAAGTAATYANLRDAAVRNAGTVDLSPAEMATAMAPVDQAADEFLPPELAKQAKTELRADMAEATIQRHLEAGNVDRAKEQLKLDRGLFAPKRASQLAAAVDRAGAGAEKDRVAGQIAGLVDTTAEAVRTEDGYVTEDELRKAVRPEGYEGQQRDQVEAEIRQRAQLEREKFKADGNKHRDNVNRSDLPGNKRAGESELWLEKYDPDFLLARQARKQAQYERRLARKDGTSTERTAAAKQQDADDEGYRYRVQRRVREDPTLTPEQIEVEYIADMKKRYGRNVAVSPPELERAGAFSVDFQQKVGTKEGAADKANGARVEKAVVAAIKRGLPKGGKVDPAALNDEVGRDMYLLQAKIEANGGKPLNELQWSEFEEQITAELTIDKPGRVYGTNAVNVGRAGQQPVYGPAAPPASSAPTTSATKRPTATGKNNEKYQLSEDGKSWELIK